MYYILVIYFHLKASSKNTGLGHNKLQNEVMVILK